MVIFFCVPEVRWNGKTGLSVAEKCFIVGHDIIFVFRSILYPYAAGLCFCTFHFLSFSPHFVVFSFALVFSTVCFRFHSYVILFISLYLSATN